MAKVVDASFVKDRARSGTAAALNLAAGAGVAERLRAAVEGIGGRIVFTTSFGLEDQLIAHHLFTERLPIEVVTLDTGRLFPETHALWQETEERYGVRIRAFHPDSASLSELVADQGINGFYHSKEARLSCCHVRKVEPLGRALTGASAWITGLRADQSGTRSETGLARWDEQRRLVKIAPLFDFTRARVAAECEERRVPVNALHRQAFLSIGCAPCTRALGPGEPERAGRWWWEKDRVGECALHVGRPRQPVRSAAG
jgi:phosphoadenosine phosphosulfate reductase